MLKDNSNGTDSRVKIVSPNASALIEGLRDFGYNLGTALADIIDNSISAGARNVEVRADTVVDDPWIAIVDDGIGMSEKELVEAMRLGSKNPRDKRSSKDLGRFGLGLKSASFSQCRRLTVLSRKQELLSVARWDLDHIAKDNHWNLVLFDGEVNNEVELNLQTNSGTTVLWQKLDRLSGDSKLSKDKKTKIINEELVRAEDHLRLVFHRYIVGTNPQLQLKLNGRSLIPIDPMATHHPATQKDPDEFLTLDNGTIRISCYTLPHHAKMTKAEWDDLGGSKGHLRSQGIYVYRENRLIIAGGWLGLAKQTEVTKLCRIAVNIPNTMDSDWKIDVKKASSQLPPLVRERLRIIIERYVSTSKRTIRRKGSTLVDTNRYPIWHRIKKDNSVIFRPNLDHPVFKNFSDGLPLDLQPSFERCLKLIGVGLPVDALYAEFAGNAEAVITDEIDKKELEDLVFSISEVLLNDNLSRDEIMETLQFHPIIKSNWDVATKFLDNFFAVNHP